jgi:hypothetical protein
LTLKWNRNPPFFSNTENDLFFQYRRFVYGTFRQQHLLVFYKGTLDQLPQFRYKYWVRWQYTI